MTEIIYKDNTVMPFGMHKGKKIGNVPSTYLLWLYDTSEQGQRMFDKKLATYIKENIEAIKMQSIAEKQRRYFERK